MMERDRRLTGSLRGQTVTIKECQLYVSADIDNDLV